MAENPEVGNVSTTFNVKIQGMLNATEGLQSKGADVLTKNDAPLSTARYIDGVAFNGNADITHYGTCSTAAATAAKTVSLTGFKLVTGARIAVKFTYANTNTSPTLNVNGTGAKAIRKQGDSVSSNMAVNFWQANTVVDFVYDGTYWMVIDGTVATTTSFGRTMLSSSINSDAEDTAATPKAVKTVNDRIDAAIQSAIQNTWEASY